MIMEIGEENGENKRVLRYTFYLNSLLLEKKERRIKFVSRFDLSRYWNEKKIDRYRSKFRKRSEESPVLFLANRKRQ